ncbi:MAG: glycine--tRNA ligase subunit beta [Candidatus Poribacteria bacterium]
MKNWQFSQNNQIVQDVQYAKPAETHRRSEIRNQIPLDPPLAKGGKDLDHLDFLLEIGTEEIPASYIEPALNQIENSIRNILNRNRIDFDNIQVFGTPRRMTASITKVATSQPDRVVEVMGPPKKSAFDGSGNPTKAGEGFAKNMV